MAHVEHVMGMPVVVDVRGELDGDVVERVFEWFRLVDETFSTYKEGSQISRIGRGELDPSEAHPDVRYVLARCEELRVETNGYFDVRAERADLLDPSGLVKGWAVDRAAALLDEAGARNYAVNAGGDIAVRGRAAPGDAWRVGIQHPLERGSVAKVVHVTGGAVATSGAYARGEHVFDPHTRRPPEGVLSVTITGPELATADAYATAAFAMGADGPAWTARLAGLRGDDDPRRRPRAHDPRVPRLVAVHEKTAGSVALSSTSPTDRFGLASFTTARRGFDLLALRARREPHCTTLRRGRARVAAGGNCRTLRTLLPATCSYRQPAATDNQRRGR